MAALYPIPEGVNEKSSARAIGQARTKYVVSYCCKEDYPLTWMDAKVEGWVVTPCRGKPVEVQALLRSLAPGHRDYKPSYDGDIRVRDAAYHQGTVWPWLIGHFLDARRRVYGNGKSSRMFLQGLEEHLWDAGIGSISEIFDAEYPFVARGCIAQAWSVAEVLRALLVAKEEGT